MINFDELEIGDVVYSYSPILGVINECTYLGMGRCMLNGKEYDTSELVPASFHSTEDEALLSSYLFYLKKVDEKIESCHRIIKLQKKRKKDLDDQYGHLRDKYPESFI